MAFIPASNVLMVEIRATFNGEELENTLYFSTPGGITTPKVEDLFDYLEDTWIPTWIAAMSDDFLVDEIYATDLTTATSPTYSRSIVPALEGPNTGGNLPGNVAVVVSFRTAGRGRSTRGRNYVGGLTEDKVTDNIFDLSTLNALVGFYELLMGGGAFPTDWVWGVLSRFINNAPRVSGLFQEIVDVLATDVIVDSQRGRLH